jgi:hypothetical protein
MADTKHKPECAKNRIYLLACDCTATPPADAALADASGIRLPIGCVCTTKANEMAAFIESAICDAELERIIEESDARWTEDMFHVHGGELMDMLRKAAALRARPQAADIPSDPPLSFTAYMEDNYPAGVRIQDPLWHAPKIWRAARRAMLAASQSDTHIRDRLADEDAARPFAGRLP